MRLPRGPLQSRNFRLLLASEVISVAGTAVAVVAIPFAVLAIGGSASDVGYVATGALVPMIACLLAGGVVADRLPRHQVIVAANAAQALSQGASAAASSSSSSSGGTAPAAPSRYPPAVPGAACTG
jgi:MFS family permease